LITIVLFPNRFLADFHLYNRRNRLDASQTKRKQDRMKRYLGFVVLLLAAIAARDAAAKPVALF
jgi:hypothetical protein